MKLKILKVFNHYGHTWGITNCPLQPNLFIVVGEDRKRWCGDFASVNGAEIGGKMLLNHYGENRVKTRLDERFN